MSDADAFFGTEENYTTNNGSSSSIQLNCSQPIKRRCRKHAGKLLRDVIRRIREEGWEAVHNLQGIQKEEQPQQQANAEGLCDANPPTSSVEEQQSDSQHETTKPRIEQQHQEAQFSPVPHNHESEDGGEKAPDGRFRSHPWIKSPIVPLLRAEAAFASWYLDATTLFMLVVHCSQFVVPDFSAHPITLSPAIPVPQYTGLPVSFLVQEAVLSTEECATIGLLVVAALLVGFVMHIRHLREKMASYDRLQKLFWILTWIVVCSCSGYGLYREKYSFKSKLKKHVQDLADSPYWVAFVCTVALTASILNLEKVLTLIGVKRCKQRCFKKTKLHLTLTQDKKKHKRHKHHPDAIIRL